MDLNEETGLPFAIGDRVTSDRLYGDSAQCAGTIRAIRHDESGAFYVVLFDLGGSAGRYAYQLTPLTGKGN